MAMWKRARSTDGSVERRIREAITDMRPLLRLDAVGIELVSFDVTSGVAMLRFQGDCPDCDMDVSMLRQGIEAHLRMQVPELRSVRAV